MNRRVDATTMPTGRLTTWIRKDYPRTAPARGHCYLLALCGIDYVGR